MDTIYITWRENLIYGYFGVGFPLHKPYPYSLYDGEDSSMLGT